MTPAWQEWGLWFAELYGLSERQAPTVAAWIEEIFVPGGATPDELRAAALDVARGGPPRFLNETLPALLDAVRSRRSEELLAREEQERQGQPIDGEGPCPWCEGVGLAIVPHDPQPDWARRSGTMATHAVTCVCSAGLRMAKVTTNHRDEALMTLARYAEGNPDWLSQRKEYERRRMAEARIGDSTREWDELVSRVVRNAKRRAR